MEQETERQLLPDTVKRVGYMLALGAHAVFIAVAAISAIILVVVLLG